MAATNAAIAIRRGLVEAQPEAFVRDLAQALEDQSSLLHDLGRPQGGAGSRRRGSRDPGAVARRPNRSSTVLPCQCHGHG